MTTILTIRAENGVLIAADSQVTVCGMIRHTLTLSKVIERQVSGQQVFIGVAGDMRYVDLIRFCPLPETLTAERDPHEWLVTEVIPALRTHCEGAGYPSDDDDADNTNTEVLIVTAGRVWRMAGDWSIFEPGGMYCAIGSGEGYVLGALHALAWHCPELAPEALARAALHAACAFDVGSSPPFTIANSEAKP